MGSCLSRSSVTSQGQPSHLYSAEARWVQLQPFLINRGYRLRPRYQPDWQPSWEQPESKIERWKAEDAIILLTPCVIDAVRVSDGQKVVVKMVPTNTDELPLLQYLNSPELRADKRNNVVEVIEVLLMPDTDDHALVIMPKLMVFVVIPFQFVSEVCDAFLEYLKGLSFLHEHGIAHMDACLTNLMMDSAGVINTDFHFCRVTRTEADVTKSIQFQSRRKAGQVRYVFIDVNISRRYPPDCTERKVSGLWGQDKTLPEFEKGLSGPIDPFTTDVGQLGNVFKRIVLRYEGLSLLAPLTESMTLPQPELRPTAQEAYETLAALVASLTEDALSQRVWYTHSTPEQRERLVNGESPREVLQLWHSIIPTKKK